VTDIFLSYAKGDRERARTLAIALQAAGWSVWWDRNIQVGQAFDQVIEHALDSAKCVVVLWSKRSISSEWVKNEAASAAERGVLVPALIDDVKLPLEFRRRQTASLVGWEQDPSHPGFPALCDGIAAAVGLPPAPRPLDSIRTRQAAVRWDRRWMIACCAVLAAILAGGAYFAVRALRPAPVAERSTADSPSTGFEAGVFDFPWPGNDCWEIDREGAKVVDGCGGAKQALQAATYTVKPVRSGVFLPFQIAVKPNAVTSAGAMAGTLDFRWPGNDCWEIDRGDAKVVDGCGGAKQALQAGTYTVRPVRSGVFLPFQIAVKPNAVTSAAMGGTLDFRWPGNDCWEIDRGEAKVVDGCGGAKQALQAGTYTVKPVRSGVFLPFQIAVKPNAVTGADAMAGTLDFRWPGNDCWEIDRGEAKVVASCGAGKQALQAGTYTVKPTSSAAFKPFRIHVSRGQTMKIP
jgi:hypothetical protein